MANPILTDSAPHVFYDTINGKYYDDLLAIAVAADAGNASLISCLAPICGNERRTDEKRKAEYVKYLLSVVTVSGADVTALLTAEAPCTCVDYDCTCVTPTQEEPPTE